MTKQWIFPAALAAVLFITSADSPPVTAGGGGSPTYDLKVTFLAPVNLPSAGVRAGVPIEFVVEVKNIGPGNYPGGHKISVSRFDHTGQGMSTQIAMPEELNPLAPGQNEIYRCVDGNPCVGSFFYKGVISPYLRDANNANNTAEKFIRFVEQDPSCDLEATFTAPVGAGNRGRSGNSGRSPLHSGWSGNDVPLRLPSGQPATFSVRLKNLGPNNCPAGSRISLKRYDAASGSPQGQIIGAEQDVPTITPMESMMRNFIDNNPPVGRFIYKVIIAPPPVGDNNEANQKPEMGVEFQQSYSVPILAATELEIQDFSLSKAIAAGATTTSHVALTTPAPPVRHPPPPPGAPPIEEDCNGVGKLTGGVFGSYPVPEIKFVVGNVPSAPLIVFYCTSNSPSANTPPGVLVTPADGGGHLFVSAGCNRKGPSGAMIFEACGGFNLKNGWRVLSLQEQNNSDDETGGQFEWMTSPAGISPHMKAKITVASDGQNTHFVKIKIQGPRGTDPYR